MLHCEIVKHLYNSIIYFLDSLAIFIDEEAPIFPRPAFGTLAAALADAPEPFGILKFISTKIYKDYFLFKHGIISLFNGLLFIYSSIAFFSFSYIE